MNPKLDKLLKNQLLSERIFMWWQNSGAVAMGMMSAYKHFMKALTSEYFDHSFFPFFFFFP